MRRPLEGVHVHIGVAQDLLTQRLETVVDVRVELVPVLVVLGVVVLGVEVLF